MQKENVGDVVYCDPTYTVAHDNNGFRRYKKAVFSWRDQIRLAASAAKASHRGALVVVSNAHYESLMALYRVYDNCEHETVQRTTLVFERSDGVSDLVFTL